MATKTRLSLLTLALAAAPVFAMQPVDRENPRVAQMAARLEAGKASLGLNADHSFKLRSADMDELGMTHASFQQLYKNVPVFGGDIITHASKTGAALPHSNTLKAGINLNVEPSIAKAEALAIAHREMAPKAAYKTSPEAELMVYPVMTLVHVRPGTDATAYEYQPVSYHLAYMVTAKVESEAQTAHRVYVVDAHTGAILNTWSDLHTTAATGTGNSQYSGTVTLNTNLNGSSYEMRDTTRGNTAVIGSVVGNSVTNLNHATSGTGTIYTDADNTWGDGANYVEGSSTTAANGETAAVDAHFGIMSTWDMYKNVLGRNGIDNTGKSSYLRVHYSNSYDNAFWDDTCFCMTFGDGSSFTTLTSIDVAGHEMSHGVSANNGRGGLNYSGESGGLNESNSDVFGTMVEFYGQGGGTAAHSTTIPATGGNWTIGEQLASTPLRYMYKPSLDGTSPDAWSSTIGSLDVHYSSGPGNRQFYFLSQGATTSGNMSTTYLPSGMTGVGNDHAARIHYRALTTYYNPTETYAQARTAHISAAQDLYGAGSPEEIAVWNSFHGINVGAAWTSTALSATVSAPSGNVTTTTNTSVTFTGAAAGGTAPYTYSWTFGDGATSTAASTSHAYTAAGTYTATFKVTDSKGATSSVTRTITVNAPGVLAASITTPSGNVTIASGTSQSFAGSASGGTSPYTYSWTFGDGGTAATASASHTYTNTGTANVTYTATFKVTDAAAATSTVTRTITVTPAPVGGSELILNGGFESGATSWTQTSGVIGAYGSSEPTHAGTYDAWMNGYGTTHTDYIYQQIAVPASGATLTFWMHIDTAETTTTTAYDTMKVQVLNTAGTVLGTLATYSNLNKATGYSQKSFSLAAYAGQTVRIKFLGAEDSSLQTSFVIDDVSAK